MARKNPDPSAEASANAPPIFSDADIAKARRWFEKGQALAAKKNYDYAIESYISGLAFWPEAVEEGHMPCRAAALFRGGQKIGFGDQMKYKTTGKDAAKAMLNAEMLLSKDTRNIGYMEAVLKNAAKGRFDRTVMWIGEILSDAARKEEKPNPARFELLEKTYEEVGDRHQQSDPALAISALERAMESLSYTRQLKPHDMVISNSLRDLASKLTILKGRYSSADSFRDSMQDGDSQAELHDKDRAVQTDERLDELLVQARANYEKNSKEGPAINVLVELLCRRERTEDENEAVGVLEKAYVETREYRYKMRADDIRMRHLNRQARRIAASGDREAAKEHLNKQLSFELGSFKERVRQYPTDLRVRYQYGVRLFKAHKYDEAIPVLQAARAEPRTRFHSGLFIGRCFFEKGYFDQAVDTFQETLGSYEIPDDELGKELHYWLGRAQEAEGRGPEALKTYGQLIQWDYNYRDVRKRIDDLRGGRRDAS